MATKRLSTDRLMKSQTAAFQFCDILETFQQYAELHERVKVFEAVVWFPRLQAMVNGTKSRGMSGVCQDVKILTWCCAGRCLIQLERGDAQLTLITADDEKPWQRTMAHVAPHMGPMEIQGIDAEFVDTLSLLYTVTRYGEEISLAPDDNVSIGI